MESIHSGVNSHIWLQMNSVICSKCWWTQQKDLNFYVKLTKIASNCFSFHGKKCPKEVEVACLKLINLQIQLWFSCFGSFFFFSFSFWFVENTVIHKCHFLPGSVLKAVEVNAFARGIPALKLEYQKNRISCDSSTRLFLGPVQWSRGPSLNGMITSQRVSGLKAWTEEQILWLDFL